MNFRFVLLILIILLFLNGCVAPRGSFKEPFTPTASKKTLGKDMATITFYRSYDYLGFLDYSQFLMNINHDYQKNTIDYVDIDNMMVADRNHYMVKEVKPGIHTFSIRGWSAPEYVAKLEAGIDYYLAGTFYLDPFVNTEQQLEFRTEEDFLADINNATQIEFTGKCYLWSCNNPDSESVIRIRHGFSSSCTYCYYKKVNAVETKTINE